MSGSDPAPDDDPRLAELLRAAGRRPQPSEAQLERWRGHFEIELSGARRRRRFRRAAGLIGGCAALLALAVLLLPGQTTAPPAAPAAPVAEVVTVFGGNVARAASDGAAAGGRRLQVGDLIAAEQRVETGLYSGLGLRYLGADLRLDAATVVVFGAARLELLAGRLYVDAGAEVVDTVRVHTPLGWFEHVGTQFLVAVTDGEVLGAVREGRIVLHHGGTELLLAAAADGARMVVVDDGVAAPSTVPASGALWAWAEASSAGLALSGRRADEVLRWVARERGQRLNYASAEARRLAEEARLGGSDQRLGPAQALQATVAATRLRVTTDDGATLTVALDSEADQDAD